MRYGEDFGAVPDWYTTLRAARYLRVPPWDLAAQHPIWTTWALEAESAEPIPSVLAALIQ